MSAAEATIERILNLAADLQPKEQAQLISRLAADLKSSLEEHERAPGIRRSLYGLLADLGPAPSAEEIDGARREMWGNFPRDDF
jgi:hypothetical protein